jgi:hypothetical protein
LNGLHRPPSQFRSSHGRRLAGVDGIAHVAAAAATPQKSPRAPEIVQ